ncbi:Bardet-Biedl syndrome 4 protein isoform X2 [Chelonus insularis]|uniref:Bardet-Biedl syndrome 4 protein isoform X2 n=1 Tax=Chelonus insularis TaxID=460826 RepID=UPI00158DEE00|nr:Bardet-Biedl syndrome 4 protein isoform X2 [Chelonus insularis]
MNNILNNGGIIPQSLQQPRNEILSSSHKKVPDLLAIESHNWLLHRHYTRHEYLLTKKLIDYELARFDNKNEYASYLKGVILRQEGDIYTSLDYFRNCYDVNSININNLKQIANSLYLLGHHKHAIESYLEALKISNTPDWQIHQGLGECYIALKNVDQAEEELKKALELTKNVNPSLKLGNLLITQNRVHDAIEVYKTSNEYSDKNIEIELGNTYLKLNDIKNAFQHYGTVLANFPKCIDATIPITYIIQTYGEFDVALSKYKSVLQVCPESFQVWNNTGMCLYKKGKHVTAVCCLKKAHFLNPLALLPSLNLGKIFLLSDQPASAVVYFCAAISNAPENFIPYLLLGPLHRLEDFDGAEKAICKAHSLAPQNPLVLVNYAAILEVNKNYEYAREILSNLKDISVVMDIESQIGAATKKILQAINKAN